MPQRLDRLRRPTDSEQMRDAINWLEKQGHSVRRPTAWQLKVGPINFYPNTGTIICDGDCEPFPHRGLAAFMELLEHHKNRAAKVLRLAMDR